MGSSQIQHPEVWLVYQWNRESKRKPWFKIWTGVASPTAGRSGLHYPPAAAAGPGAYEDADSPLNHRIAKLEYCILFFFLIFNILLHIDLLNIHYLLFISH